MLAQIHTVLRSISQYPCPFHLYHDDCKAGSRFLVQRVLSEHSLETPALGSPSGTSAKLIWAPLCARSLLDRRVTCGEPGAAVSEESWPEQRQTHKSHDVSVERTENSID